MTAIRKQTALWTCKDGSRIRICDMGTTHIENAVKAMERIATQREAAFLMSDNPYHGEQAAYMFDSQQEAVQEEGLDPEDVFPLYGAMKDELERRKQYAGKAGVE